jgi:hypothetical protein
MSNEKEFRSRAGVHEIRARLQRLEVENERLQKEVDFLRGNPMIAKGMRGETLVANWVSSQRSRRGAGHDIKSIRTGLRFEVKYSSLLDVIAGRPLKRWAWTKLFGELGRKEYEHLLLVGDADPRFAAHYADPESPYVLFDVPYDLAIKFTGGVKLGRSGAIQLTTNPLTVKSSRALALFHDCQTSVSELRRRYGDLEVA